MSREPADVPREGSFTTGSDLEPPARGRAPEPNEPDEPYRRTERLDDEAAEEEALVLAAALGGDPGWEEIDASVDESPDEASLAWPPQPSPDLDAAAALELLRDGDLELVGRLVASSNNAMVGTVTLSRPGCPTLLAPCVYKPIAGERPLWDFPDGTLAAREAAAFVLSEGGGWSLVPPTVLRAGPFGEGMVQLWVEPDPSIDAVALVVEGDERLRGIALFDAVANNADRKIGHLLPMSDRRVLGVDHGICFHAEPKLRTVLWQWRGARLTAEELSTLRRVRAGLDGPLGIALGRLLAPVEVRALARRLHRLVVDGRFPHPDPDRPAIPWPPY